MKKLEDGYTLPTVIIIITVLSMTFSVSAMYITHFIGGSYRVLKKNTGWESYYTVLDELRVYFEQDIRDDYTSPWSGWFSRLPSEIDGFSISCELEDSKLDINHIDDSIIEKSGLLKEKSTTGKRPGYYYFPDQVTVVYPQTLAANMSIYQVPNLNTATIASLKIYLRSQQVSESLTEQVAVHVQSRRSGRSHQAVNGLLIDQTQYEVIRRMFPRNRQDDCYRLLDYSGRINCNVVSKETFIIAVRACDPSGSSADRYWRLVEAKQKSRSSITDLKEIFGNRWRLYQKYFSVESNLFRVSIEKGDKKITALIRRYRDFRGKSHAFPLLLTAHQVGGTKQ
jgi:hypothetical protein